MRALTILIATGLVAGSLVAPAGAGPGFFFGMTDDRPKTDGAGAVEPARDLGARAFRITLWWNPGQTQLAAAEITDLNRAASAAAGIRIALAVYGAAASAPQDDAAREAYCTYVRGALARFPSINDVVIWNEPNKSFFWRPQFNPDGSSAAPAAYTALLARCWDVLRALRPAINVIAPATAPRGNDDPSASSNVSHSPGNFIRKMGEAYRASGRSGPLFDTVGHHVHPNHSSERPWREHNSTTVGLADLDKLLAAFSEGFGGTGQPVPGQCREYRCVRIWYLELGYQTFADGGKEGLYTGTELDPEPLPDWGGEPSSPVPGPESFAPDQGTQFRDAVRLAACQPYVEALFNFLLWDEVSLEGWQSGPFWANRMPKHSVSFLRQAVSATTSGTVNCRSLKGYLPYREVVLRSVPSAYFRLDEPAGAAQVADELGGAAGAYAGATPGALGALPAETATAGGFDGSDDGVDLSERFGFSATAPFSFEAWVAPGVTSPPGTPARIASKEQVTPSEEGWSVSRAENGGVAFSRMQSGVADVATTGPIPSGVWTHLVATYNGATMRIYLNGIEKGSIASQRPLAAHPGSLTLGKRSDGTLPFAGRLDEVAVYSIPLTREQAKDHYTTGVKRPAIVPDTVPPAAPASLAAVSLGTSILVDWADAEEGDVVGYDILRAPAQNGPYVRLNVAPVGASAYTDAGLMAGVRDHYLVRAVDSTGNVGPTSGASSQTSADLVGAVTCGSTSLSAAPPTAVGQDPVAPQWVVWRTLFYRYDGAAWQLVSSVAPFLVGYAAPGAQASAWWVLDTGTPAGSTSTVRQSYTIVPPSGWWLALQEVHRYSSTLQYAGGSYLVPSLAGGPNAVGAVCYWP